MRYVRFSPLRVSRNLETGSGGGITESVRLYHPLTGTPLVRSCALTISAPSALRTA